MEFRINTDCLRFYLKVLGVGGSILILWNGVCDLIYGYSPTLRVHPRSWRALTELSHHKPDGCPA